MTRPSPRRILPVTAAAIAALCLVGTSSAAGAGAASVAHRPVAARQGAVSKSGPGRRWVMGYYPIYQRGVLPINEIDWSAMTHLVVGAVVPKPNGSLDTTFDDDAVHGPKIAKRLASAAKAHGVVPILMVGGAGVHDSFAAAASHHRGRLVKNLLSTMRSYGFAGLDLDWEPVTHRDQPAVRRLVTALRKRAPHTILTMPVLWVSTTFPKVPALYGTLARKLDRINIMTYGMAGAYDGWKTWYSSALKGASPSTPSDVAENVHAFEAAGVPARKLGIGIGFYGTCWTGGVSGPRQAIGSSYVAADDNVMTYPHIMSAYYSASAYHYDRTARAPYLGFSQPTGPQQCTFISYENPRSIAAKGAYAEKHGLGSEIIWTINQGHVKGAPRSKADPLLEAVHRSFH